MQATVPARDARAREDYRVCLLDGFVVLQGDGPIEFSETEQRLIAYLALRGKPVPRANVMETLWAESSGSTGCLRSAVHRVRRRAPRLLASTDSRLGIDDEVEVDVTVLNRACRDLLASANGAAVKVLDPATLTAELLPGWADEWVLVAREWLRQRFLHTIEEIGARELAAGQPAEAIDVALLAVAMEPLRESPRRLLVSAHLADGNPSEAVRDYRRYGELLRCELGLRPTERLRSLLPPEPTD